MWKNTNDLSDGQLMAEFRPFKIFSGQFQCRILGETEYQEAPYFFMGSGGYLKHRGRYFLITNEHVARQSPIERIRAVCVGEGQRCAKFTSLVMDKCLDLAVFEIADSCITGFDGKSFLSDTLLDLNATDHLMTYNPVFLHASPSEKSEIDFDKGEINIETFPYLTFAKWYDNDYFVLDANLRGINEFGQEADVPTFFGMSGSWAYGHYPETPLIPFKCIGLLSLGDKNAGNMRVLNIDIVVDFIDRNF